MTTVRLATRRVEKPWGRRDICPAFGTVSGDDAPVGEVWFDDPEDAPAPLMVKYLFTSERLSIQVHPNDAQARARGYRHGKEECWIILSAKPDATLGIGLKNDVSPEVLRAAVLDGSIEWLMDWKPVKAGDIIYLPAGTIHAIGAGLTLVEIQQNMDLTYRLYDYGRLRELHLEDGLAVAKAEPFRLPDAIPKTSNDRTILSTGGKFTVEEWRWSGSKTLLMPAGLGAWCVPLDGTGQIDGANWALGECWHVGGRAQLDMAEGARVLVAYASAHPIDMLG